MRAVKFTLLGVILAGLPLAGLMLAGIPIAPYLTFPPRPRHGVHAAFSWPVFWLYAALIAVAVIPLVRTGVRAFLRCGCGPPPRGRWPGWGTAVLAAGAIFWVLAWSRFAWFAPLQPHTFAPLWLCYIGTMNALTCRRTGRSMLTHQPARMAGLFAASAVFWWFFEYLNRFVENWYYQGVEYGPAMYAVLATVSFATVLPAVLSTRDWLLSFDLFRRGWAAWPAVPAPCPRALAVFFLILSGAGMVAIGLWPDILFALVWVAPLIVAVSLQTLFGQAHVLGALARGRWAETVASAVAALICGLFWEMWNAGSLVGWIYSVPYVQRFEIFAMPVLGYAGYLPFGLECAIIEQLLFGSRSDRYADIGRHADG